MLECIFSQQVAKGMDGEIVEILNEGREITRKERKLGQG